jgi:hypothetical protein
MNMEKKKREVGRDTRSKRRRMKKRKNNMEGGGGDIRNYIEERKR